VRKTRWVLLSLQQSQFKPQGQYNPQRSIIVRQNLIPRTGDRKKTLRLGLLLAGRVNKNVLLYKKPQPNPTQFYPVFTPWRRRLKALGNKVAPTIPVGPTGSGMNLQHYLGLSLMQLGGVRF
jgi:hypothetical protein